jgi:hypothetical protein
MEARASEMNREEFIRNPLKGLTQDDLGMSQEDFTEAQKSKNRTVVYKRLHTTNFEAVFFPANGRLILLFPDGQR